MLAGWPPATVLNHANIVDAFRADRQTDHPRRNARSGLLPLRKLLMRRTGRMDNERLGIADVPLARTD